MKAIIFLYFYFFQQILNQNIIDIFSFQPYRIPEFTEQIIFKYEYQTNETSDIIIYISPELNKKVVGQLLISTNLTNLKLFNNKNKTENIGIFYLNYEYKSSITINPNNDINIGQNIYYFLLSGNIDCEFEIFLSIENRILSLENSYYFPMIYNMTSEYLSLRINNIDKQENIFMNIFKRNKDGDSIVILENGRQMILLGDFPIYIELESNNYYYIFISYKKYDDIAINFVNNIIHDLNEYPKNLNISIIQNFILFLIILRI